VLYRLAAAAALILAVAVAGPGGAGARVRVPLPDSPPPSGAVDVFDTGRSVPQACEFRGLLIDSRSRPFLEPLLRAAGPDLIGAPDPTTVGLEAVLYPAVGPTELRNVIARLNAAFNYAPNGIDDTALLLAALGVGPNGVLHPAPRVTFGPVTRPVAAPAMAMPKLGGKKSVLVLDTGFHAAAAPFASGDPDLRAATADLVEPYAGHGTFIAGVLARAGAPAIGSITVRDLWGTQEEITEIDVLRVTGSLRPAGTPAFDGVDLSFGGYPCRPDGTAAKLDSASSSPADYLQPVGLRRAIGDLLDLNAARGRPAPLMAAAAGNDHTGHPYYPAAFWSAPTPAAPLVTVNASAVPPTVVDGFNRWRSSPSSAVVDLRGKVHSIGATPVPLPAGPVPYSNFGPWVEVAAVPGCLVSTMPRGDWTWGEPRRIESLKTGYAWSCGTSFAAPNWLGSRL